jgi:Protein of unknown function (DUF3078).
MRRKLFVSVLLLIAGLSAQAQTDTTRHREVIRLVMEIASKVSSPADPVPAMVLGFDIDNATVEELKAVRDSLRAKLWTKGTLLQLGFSQMALSNWNAGGSDNLALNAYVNMYRNYALENMFWESRLQMGYGFMTSFGTNYKRDRFKKTDDRLIFDTKLGYRAIKDLFASVMFNFRSQFANGYTYPADKDTSIVASAPFSPAYFSLGTGLDYKPIESLSINVSPLTGNLVVIGIRDLRTKYGNREDQVARMQLGAQVKVDYKKAVTNSLNVESTLNLFSDYLGVPKNIKVYWDLFIDTKLSKYFSTTIKTNLIYDDEILIADKEGRLAPRLQFKEMFSVGFSYTFGEFKK